MYPFISFFSSSTDLEKTDAIGRETGGILRCLQRCGWGVGAVKVVAGALDTPGSPGSGAGG